MSDKDTTHKAKAVVKETDWKQEWQTSPWRTTCCGLIIIGMLGGFASWLPTRVPGETWGIVLGVCSTLLFSSLFIKTAIDVKKTDPSNIFVPLFIAVLAFTLFIIATLTSPNDSIRTIPAFVTFVAFIVTCSQAVSIAIQAYSHRRSETGPTNEVEGEKENGNAKAS